MVNTANMVFHQNWKLSKEKVQDKEEEARDTEEEREENEDENKEKSDEESTSEKVDRSLTFPARSTIRNWLEDASYLNLKHVADHIMNKGENVVTVGLDDHIKAAARHTSYIVKADNILPEGPHRFTLQC